MNCLIADDHWVVRKGMISIVKNHFPDLIFDQACGISEIFLLLERKSYSLLFLDFLFADGALNKSIAQIKSISNNAKIIVMSSSVTYFDYLEIKNYINAIVSKQSTQASIIQSIEKVLLNDGSYENNYHQAFFNKVDLLSDRELEIVKLIFEGYGNKEMVNKLGLKENTISTMRKRAFDKLSLDNNVELINFFLQSVI
jgi:DNA-binding NarL/FixJ family response regulator